MSGLESWKMVSEIFLNFVLGISSLVGVVVGAPALLKMIKVNRLRRQYPVDKLGIDFKLVDTDKAPGKIYLIEIHTRAKRWIESSGTFLDLRFYWDKVERISQEEFDSYEQRDGILTTGKRGH